MGLTTAQRHNRKLDKTFSEPIADIKRTEEIASKILDVLREEIEIDPCGLSEWALIDLIAKTIRENQNA